MRLLAPLPAPALALVLALACTLAPASSAQARVVWPQPAAGDSASGDPEVLFTFDDGPDERYTARILDTLEQRGIKTIFFWAGWRARGTRPIHDLRRSLVHRAVAAGHVIGNHTINHVHLCTVPESVAREELDGNMAIYTPLQGLPPPFFRAPYGDRCPRLEVMLAERGLRHLHWDLDPMEWENPSADAVYDYLVDRIGRLEGRAVVLLHDTKPAAARALPRVLDWIDAENARRLAKGRRPIRLLSYMDLAREWIPLDVRRVVDAGAGAAAALVPDLMTRLVAPLAGHAPSGNAGLMPH